MTKKEIAEIRKQFSAKENVRVVAVRLVGPGKRIEMEGTEKFSDLPEDVRDEYVAILKKALDGRNSRIGRNLTEVSVGTEKSVELGKYFSLPEHADCANGLPEATEAVFGMLTADMEKPYIIIAASGTYDVPKTEGNYAYCLTVICPVQPSKSGLAVDYEDKAVRNRVRDLGIEDPAEGFLYPAFNNRMEDMDAALLYCRTEGADTYGIAESVFGAKMPATGKTDRKCFSEALERGGCQGTFDKVLALNRQVIREAAEAEAMGEDAVGLCNMKGFEAVLQGCGFAVEEIAAVQDAFGGRDEIRLENIAGIKDITIKASGISAKVSAEHVAALSVRTVGGRACLVWELADGAIEVNGIRTTVGM